MYLQAFGLREKPFALSPDPRYLFLAESHREALAHLLYGVDQGEGFIAVVGEVGTGKTTLCRTLLQRLGSETEVAFLFNPDLSPLELLEAVCTEYGVSVPSGASRRDLLDRINEFLVHNKRQDRRVLLIIDEAQNLPDETLEQVRLLSNLETETSKLIQIILLGQPELETKLGSQNLRQLRQRISVWWTLGPLTRAETADYVRHRLRVAGGASRACFSEGALRELHRRSLGVPRVVNILCERALLAAYAEDARDVQARHVRSAVAELGPGRPGTPAARAKRLALHPGWLVAAGIAAIAFGAWQWTGGGVPDLRSGTPSLPAVAAPPPPPSGPAQGLDDPMEDAAPVPDDDLRDLPRDAQVQPPPPDLETLLASTAADDDAAVVAAVLESWALDASPPLPGVAQLSGALRKHDLRLIRMDEGSLAAVDVLNYPAVIQIEAADGTPRWVVLRHLEGKTATLVGLEGDGPTRIPIHELEARFTGRALVPWRDFVRTPPVLRDGHAGSSVLWLQRKLALLGFYGAEPSGRYDELTREAVREFQSSRGLRADGEVGPRTKMILYDALGAYAFPRLREAG